MVTCCSEWPRILELLRALCRFFRQEPYRRHIVRNHDDTVDADIRGQMKSFTASLAKWRFETMDHVLGSLLYIKDTCRLVLRDGLFKKVKDVELLKKSACGVRLVRLVVLD